MPGGEQAIREPWRLGLAHLRDARVSHPHFEARLLHANRQTVDRMLERRFRTPLTSSMGRLFDAVASLAGVTDRVSYEGQAAIQLESLASASAPAGAYSFEITDALPHVIDTRPLIADVVEDATRGADAATIARRFHATIVEIIAGVCARLRRTTGVEAVVLSGGVFQSVLLTQQATTRLANDGFRVYRHRLVPPNDGGLSLGQLAIAAAILNQERSKGEADVSWDSRQGHRDLPRA
jgi:hydrogenase maturation protein HypF